ncbi:leucine-rich repeat, cysteine-containing subtype protein [Tanacetum coccineum]
MAVVVCVFASTLGTASTFIHASMHGVRSPLSDMEPFGDDELLSPFSKNLTTIMTENPSIDPNLQSLSLTLVSHYFDPQEVDYEEGEYEFYFDDDVYSLVRSCKNLADLYLDECVGVTDESLKAIGESNSLKHCGVNVTDTRVVSLTRIPNIERLELSWLSSITDISLCETVRKCLKLKRIGLSGCDAISGEGLCVFAHHPTLTWLALCRVTIFL